MQVNHRFHFENHWLHEPDIYDVVQIGWRKGVDGDIISKLDGCIMELDQWGRKLKRKFHDDITHCKNRLLALRGCGDVDAVQEALIAKNKLATLLIQEEPYWRQWAKTFWLRDRDNNTRYFHVTANSKKKRNHIMKLHNADNVEVHEQTSLCQIANDYFVDLFQGRDGVYEPVLDIIEQRLSVEDNDMLTGPFIESEFRNALFQMHSDKAPDPHGLNPGFYERFWSMCGKDIVAAGCKWLDDGVFLTQLSATNIVLIPKCDEPKSMKDLQPISLCNVLYKIVSKVLANRLRKVIGKLISEEQSAFIAGHSILDNALIAIEFVHFMKCQTKGKNGDVALKIDISKAYDKIIWLFLKGMMWKLGFSNTWINWIMMCVESVNYSVQVNEDQVGPIIPSRGLRQEDPLSPYLFILCAEGLSALIKNSELRVISMVLKFAKELLRFSIYYM